MNKLPFAAEQSSREFMRALTRMLASECQRRCGKHVATDNTQVYYHGRYWTSQREEDDGYSTQTSEISPHTTTRTIDMDRILENDVELVPDFLRETAQKFEDGIVSRLAGLIASTAEETGRCFNIPRNGPIDFVALSRAIDFIVGSDGNVHRPVLHLDADVMDRISREEALITPEQHRQIDAICTEKEQEARDREKARLERYRQV